MTDMTTIPTLITASKSAAGKLWVARVLGPDPKFGVKREFVATKTDKKGRHATATITVAGVYECSDGEFVLVTADGESFGGLDVSAALSAIDSNLPSMTAKEIATTHGHLIDPAEALRVLIPGVDVRRMVSKDVISNPDDFSGPAKFVKLAVADGDGRLIGIPSTWIDADGIMAAARRVGLAFGADGDSSARADVIAQIRKLMAEHDITVSDL